MAFEYETKINKNWVTRNQFLKFHNILNMLHCVESSNQD